MFVLAVVRDSHFFLRVLAAALLPLAVLLPLPAAALSLVFLRALLYPTCAAGKGGMEGGASGCQSTMLRGADVQASRRAGASTCCALAAHPTMKEVHT